MCVDMKSGGREKVLLIDGHGLAFRAFYALPEMNAPNGTPTNAILGTMNMLLKAEADIEPARTVLFFDPHGPTARDAMFDRYKAQRAPAPDAFKVQMPLIIKLVELLGYPVFIRDGFEADDVIASTAVSLCADNDVMILTADKDLMQILRPGITMMRPIKGSSEFKIWTEAYFKEEYGFGPPSMADYLALVGDSSDNIPGVPGIGDKTARALLSKYPTIDAIYADLPNVAKSAAGKLEKGRELARLSLSLVVPLETEPADIMDPPTRGDAAAAAALCRQLGLKRIAERLGLACEGSEISDTDTPVARSEVELVLSKCPLEDLKGADTLALAAGERSVLMDESGRWTEASPDEVSQMIAAGDRRIITADLRTSAKLFPMLYDDRENIFDVCLAHYFYHPDAKSHSISEGEGAEKCARMICDAHRYMSDPHKDDMLAIMHKIDIPLCPVLDSLEEAGLRVDASELTSMARDLEARVRTIEGSIVDAAGYEIDLNSPKQVGELLFERLRLPVVKKTKTGSSTDASVLEELASLPEPLNAIPRMMIEYRESAKILSAFVEPFIKYAQSSDDGRVHSTFRHDVTGTGRLASRSPNVQNIPAFGEWARRFRSAIEPSDGMVFVAADYSQIELRVLAHLSNEPRLIDAFSTGRDIHRETASWVFSVAPEDVTAEQRRYAKTVNFGLIYGMSAHGLAARMGIKRRQASGLIESYFSVLPNVKRYLEQSASDARSVGYTRSIFGRMRPLAEAGAGEGRGAIDRIAVNTPIQSAASDIAKIAMIRSHDAIKIALPCAKFVLQVHDSLVCEVPAEHADEAERILVECMESVDVMSVPMKAEPKRGTSLADI